MLKIFKESIGFEYGVGEAVTLYEIREKPLTLWEKFKDLIQIEIEITKEK